MDVNTWWICDFGRFDFKYLNDDKRLAAPQVDGREIEWPKALDAAAAAIKSAPAGTLAYPPEVAIAVATNIPTAPGREVSVVKRSADQPGKLTAPMV